MPNFPGPGQLLAQLGGRVLTVAVTWAILVAVALLLDPYLALAGAVIPLGLAARAAWRARTNGDWHSLSKQLRRRVSTIALLLAGAFFLVTARAVRPDLPGWKLLMALGLLLHYWLLSLG